MSRYSSFAFKLVGVTCFMAVMFFSAGRAYSAEKGATLKSVRNSLWYTGLATSNQYEDNFMPSVESEDQAIEKAEMPEELIRALIKQSIEEEA